MDQRALGADALNVGALGLGCMGMTFGYKGADEAECRATIADAIEAGITLFDTADVYGPHTNEILVGEALGPFMDDVLVATKFGITPCPDGGLAVDGTPEYVRRSCEGSLGRLGIEVIDLYYQHRVDPDVPIEETVGAMSELVAAGKVRHLGLSEASAETIRRAHAVHPIAAVQSEFSLWSRDVEREVLPTMRELGIGLVAYSPLGRGFLAGALRAREQIAEGDTRRAHPRFADDNLQHNLALLERLESIAAQVGTTLSQVALAWVLGQGEDIVAIPGTTKRTHLRENLTALGVQFEEEELADLRDLLDAHPVAGERYPEPMRPYVQT